MSRGRGRGGGRDGRPSDAAGSPAGRGSKVTGSRVKGHGRLPWGARGLGGAPPRGSGCPCNPGVTSASGSAPLDPIPHHLTLLCPLAILGAKLPLQPSAGEIPPPQNGRPLALGCCCSVAPGARLLQGHLYLPRHAPWFSHLPAHCRPKCPPVHASCLAVLSFLGFFLQAGWVGGWMGCLLSLCRRTSLLLTIACPVVRACREWKLAPSCLPGPPL